MTQHTYLVIEGVRHSDPRYYIYADKDIALDKARELVAYWSKGRERLSYDTTCYGDELFSHYVEGLFSIIVMRLLVTGSP